MNKGFLLSFTFLMLLFCHQLSAQQINPDKALLKGQLLDGEDKSPIPFVHVTNLNRAFRAVSDNNGFFNLPASTGDTLLLSAVTYGQHKIVVQEQREKLYIIELLPNVYELEEVVVKSLPSERRFKEMLLGMDAPEEANPDLQLPSDLYQEVGSGNGAVSLGSPVSALAGKFSKKERGRRFAAEIKVKEARETVIFTKFNREVVQEITGLEDEEKLDAFMEYCVLSEDFLYKASEYEIHKAVLGCFGDFIKEQEG